jgi:predicted nuclease of predicted toxin-antitoxin system
MSLRFFADHCVPTSVIQALRDAEHSVFLLRDHVATDSEDGMVITKAQELEAILVSLNDDFSDIVTFPPSRFKGIVAIQVRNHPEAIPAIIRRLMSYLSAHVDQEDYAGKLFLVEGHRIRIR